MSDYLQAWKLFFEKKLWEAHEVWEALWRQAAPQSRPFLQALIQICALGIKLERKEMPAAERLRRRALELLSECSLETWKNFQLPPQETIALVKVWQGDPAEFQALRPFEIREETSENPQNP